MSGVLRESNDSFLYYRESRVDGVSEGQMNETRGINNVRREHPMLSRQKTSGPSRRNSQSMSSHPIGCTG